MDVAQRQGDDPKHPVLASVLMGILRALDEESTGKSSSSSSSDDHVIFGLHGRREPPCRRRLHGQPTKVEEKPVEEHVLPSDEELLSPKQDYPTPDFVRSPTGSPNLHTILETEEEGEGKEEEQDGSFIVERMGNVERIDSEREIDSVKQLQKEDIKPCSSTSSPLVTSDDSDIAAFLSKHEYATLFGPESSNSDKILIPSRFVQNHGEVSSYTKTGVKSLLKRGSDENLERAQIKKQKADSKPLKSPPKIAKRKLESLLGDAIKEFTQNIEESSIERDTRRDSGQQAISSDRETRGEVSAEHSYETTETASTMGRSDVDSLSQRKRLKTSEESELSSEGTISSDTLSDDTVEESTASSFYDETRVDTTGKHKKKIKRSLRSLRSDTSAVGKSDFSSDGQTGTLRPSMMGKMPGPKVGLGTYGWNLGTRKDAKNMLQKAVSTSLDEFSDTLSPDLQISTDQSVTLGKTDTTRSGSVHEVSGSRDINGSDRTRSTGEEFGHFKSSPLSGSTMSSDLGTIQTSSKKSSANASQSSQLGNELQQEYISRSVSTTSSDFGKIQTSSEKSGADTGQSSEIRMDLQVKSSSRSVSNISDLETILSSSTKSISTTGQSSSRSVSNVSSDLGKIISSTKSISTTGQSSEVKSELQEESNTGSVSTMSSDLESFPTTEKSGYDTAQSSDQRNESQGSIVSSTMTSGTTEEDFESISSSEEEFGVETILSGELKGELQEDNMSSKMTSETNEDDWKSATLTSIGSASEFTTSSESEELTQDLDMLPSSSSTIGSGMSSSKRSGIDPRDLPEVLRTGSSQPVISPLVDFYSSLVSSDGGNASSNASTHFNQSGKSDETSRSRNVFIPSSDVYSTSTAASVESKNATSTGTTTTPTESPEEHTGYGSYQSGKTASSNASTHLNQSGKSDETSRSRNSFIPSSDVYSTSTAASVESKTATTTGTTVTPTESPEEHTGYGSYQSGKIESVYHSSDYTTGEYSPSSSSSKSITTAIPSPTGEEISTTDFADKSPKLLSNINLTEALLRSDPSPTNFEDSDSLTASSDEYIIDRLKRETPQIRYKSVTETTSTSDVVEDTDITSGEIITDSLEEPIEDILDGDMDLFEVPEEPVRDSMKVSVLPVLLEDENEESSDNLSKDAEGEESDSIPVVESGEETIQETSSLTSGNESSTSYGEIPSSGEHLFMIDLDKNEMVFEDTPIVNDTSVSSIESGRLPKLQPDAQSSETSQEIPIEILPASDEFNLVDFALDITQFVMLNAVARVYADILVNVAIRRLTEEQDFSLQMEKALFPGIQDERRERPIYMHWISPPCFSLARDDRPLAVDDTGLNGDELQEPCQRTVRDEKEEKLMICLERAFFPCLAYDESIANDNIANDDNIHIRRLPVPSEAPPHLLPEVSAITDEYNMDRKTKACRLTGFITAASRVSIFAAETISQMWSIMTSVSWTVWNYLRENLDVKKVKRKDESTQCDEGSCNDTFRDDEMTEWMKKDEVNLHVLASRVVASAVTNAVWGKQYVVSPASSEHTIEWETRSNTSIPTDLYDNVLSRQRSNEDYQLKLSASSVVEQVVANAVMIYDSTCIEEFHAMQTEVSNQSLSSGKDSQIDEDSVSACSLSDIPLSSITFMRQQLADMKEIFQSTIPGNKAEINSPLSVVPMSPEDASSSSSPQISSVVPLNSENETTPVSELESCPDGGKTEKRATEGIEIMKENISSNGVDEKTLPKQYPEAEDSCTVRETDNHDSNENVVEDVSRDFEPIPAEKKKFVQNKNGLEPRIIESSPDNRKNKITEHDRDDKTTETQNESAALLSNTSKSGEQDEENVNASDLQEGDSSSTSSSALSLSDVPFSGISYIREQLANVKTLANSIMDDFNSYAEERTLVGKRSSQLTCSAASIRSQSSCDTSCTIENSLSISSSGLNVHGDSKVNESENSQSDRENEINLSDQKKDGKKDDRLDESIKSFSKVSGASLERPNENGNAKTHRDGHGRPTKKIDESKQEKGNSNEGLTKQKGFGKHSNEQSIKETTTDRNQYMQMKEELQTKEIAKFSRNSPGRLNVIPRRKGASHHHGMHSGESSCSTDYSPSVVSRPSSSFSDGSVSSGSRNVTVESESQGKGRTDVSCRISDRGIWVNTAFVNEIDGDQIRASIADDDHESKRENVVKNKIMINVKMSPRSRKKHHSYRVRSKVRDTQMLLAQEDTQKPLAILDNEVSSKKHGDMMITQESKQIYEEVNLISETKSLKADTKDSRIIETKLCNGIVEGKEYQTQVPFHYGQNDGQQYQAEHFVKRLAPKKESGSESHGLEESRKADGDRATDTKPIMRECLSDGAVSEHHQLLSRRLSSLKKKPRETKPSDSPCPSCAEKSNHPGDLLAAPVISRSERTRAVLSMLDDVAENLSLDTSVHDDTGSAKTMDRMGSFRKLFGSKKKKRKKGNIAPGQSSPRVISDSSFTESDGESASPECSSDSSHTSRSNSSASLLSNVLRNLSLKRRKKKPKGLTSSTPKSTKARKGSISAFDEMLGDLEEDFFIDDSFPNLVSARDSSPSEDNTSLNDVLQDLVEEWSFDGLQEALDSYPQSIRERIRGKLHTFMNEVRKEKRRAQLLLSRTTTL